ncbi:MFS transporter [Peribacillus simplex]|uniref:MFS transporter n=1 Tax=Peribacillus simplex TaxID=1478 RepID=UPI003D066C49
MMEPLKDSKPTMDEKPTRFRFYILALLFVATAINYMDRANLSVAGSTLQQELGLTATQLGLLFSAFTWAYVVAQVPAGWLLDRIGPRHLYGWAIIIWSFFTLIMALSSHNIFASTTSSFMMLLICRMLIGVAEAPGYPSNTKIATMWFPNNERARATSIYASGQYIGLAIFTPLLGIMVAKISWESVFYTTGAIGIIFGILWLILYRDPQNSKRANQSEKDYIKANGGFDSNQIHADSQKVSFAEVMYVVKQRKVWGIFFAQFAGASTLYFFLTWFIVYLEQGLKLPIAKAGFAATLPYLMAMAGVLFGGFLSDSLLKKGRSLTVARKIPIVSGLIISSMICLANFFEDSPIIAVVILSIAFFANAAGNMGWVALGDVLPKKMVGTVGGILNVCGNLAGIISPIIFGTLLEKTGSFHWAMYYTSAVALLGGISFLLIIDKLEIIDLSGMDSKKN